MGECSVSGCDRKARGHGYCKNHYYRFVKHGDPLHVDNAWGEAQKFFEARVLTYRGNKCLIWPFARNDFGYAMLWHEGRMHRACRLICEAIHGSAPKLFSAHSCGKGKLGCVNPKHLRWATKAENEADKLKHGTSNRGRRRVITPASHQNVRSRRTQR